MATRRRERARGVIFYCYLYSSTTYCTECIRDVVYLHTKLSRERIPPCRAAEGHRRLLLWPNEPLRLRKAGLVMAAALLTPLADRLRIGLRCRAIELAPAPASAASGNDASTLTHNAALTEMVPCDGRRLAPPGRAAHIIHHDRVRPVSCKKPHVREV